MNHFLVPAILRGETSSDHTVRILVSEREDHSANYVAIYTDKRAIVSRKNWDHPMMKWILMEAHIETLKPHNDSTSPTGIYIPQNLDDAVKELDALLPAADGGQIELLAHESHNAPGSLFLVKFRLQQVWPCRLSQCLTDDSLVLVSCWYECHSQAFAYILQCAQLRIHRACRS